MALSLTIVSPEKTLYQGEVDFINVPGKQGAFEVLVNHAPIISSLSPGQVTYGSLKGERQELIIQGGFIEVNRNVVSVCVTL